MEANANDGKSSIFGLGPAVGYETGSLNGEDLEGVSYQLRAFKKCFAPIHTLLGVDAKYADLNLY